MALPEEIRERLVEVDYSRAERVCPQGLAIADLMRQAREFVGLTNLEGVGYGSCGPLPPPSTFNIKREHRLPACARMGKVICSP